MKIKIKIENFTISTKISKSIQVKDLLKQIKNSQIINSNGDELKLLDSNYQILEDSQYLNIPEKIEIKQNENEHSHKNSFLINSNNISNSKNNSSVSVNKQQEQEEIRFYLIKYPKLKNKKDLDPEDFKSNKNSSSLNKKQNNQIKKVEIEDLIMKATNAKTKIDSSKFKQKESSSTERLNLIDELINSSLGNIMGENPNSLARGNIREGTHNVSQLLSILRPIIGNETGEGDVIINRSNRGPGSIIVNRAGHSRASVVPDENSVNSLKEMGFPEEQCRRALIMERNNVSAATDYLLSGDLDLLPIENLHPYRHQIINNSNGTYSSNTNQNNNNNNNTTQTNQISDMSNQEDEYMHNEYDEGQLLDDEEMSDIPENISNNINFQNIPNLEVYINNFINNNQQDSGNIELNNTDSNNNNHNDNENNNGNSDNNNNNNNNNSDNNNNN